MMNAVESDQRVINQDQFLTNDQVVLFRSLNGLTITKYAIISIQTAFN